MNEQLAVDPAFEVNQENQTAEQTQPPKEQNKFYRIRFRAARQAHSAYSRIQNIKAGEIVMVQTDHGLEPATTIASGVLLPIEEFKKPPALCNIVRRGSREEAEKFENLINREQDAFKYCQERIASQKLVMKLINVERYFNGSKIIFYFTAENRVDFRNLVKELVQEFRTRVEMRQIGVRHETQMLGGIGCCGRELCCNLFMQNFVPVSIKMAKEQDLPLNPAKISGACNRLLCCLTHEFETYKYLKKDMPKVGKQIQYKGQQYKVVQNNTLKGTIAIVGGDKDEFLVLNREEWKETAPVGKQKYPADNQKAADQPKLTEQEKTADKQKAVAKSKSRSKSKGPKKTKAK